MTVTSGNVGAKIIDLIPELTESVEDNAELCHLTLADLFDWTKTSTEAGKLDNLRRAIWLLDSIVRDCDTDVRNAVAVSFLESVNPDEAAGRQIFDELTPALKELWRNLDQYLQQLIGKSLSRAPKATGSSRIK